jgi:hypothetical protein
MPPPLERLTYHPGQRLDAVDLNLEVAYELSVRRLLNQGLFSAGVVSGLEVTKSAPRQVLIATGLALDANGRELYLAATLALALPNHKPAGGGDAYYLVITYDETKVAAADTGCSAPDGKAFSRIRETPQLAFTADWPNPKLCTDSFPDLNCGIVLATVTLDKSCQIASIDTGVRQYSFPTHSSQVHEASFEGEKDIAVGESKRLFFHVRGGAPSGVALFLRGAAFSKLFYTELGRHNHGLTNVPTTPETAPIDTTHTHDTVTVDSGDQSDKHHHTIHLAQRGTLPGIATFASGGAFDSIINTHGTTWIGDEANHDPNAKKTDDSWVDALHHHSVPAKTTTGSTRATAPQHEHTFAAGITTLDAGAADVAARTAGGDLAYSTIDALQVTLDNIDVTASILLQIGWTTPLGGTMFNSDQGTGGIDLLRLPPVTGQSPPPVINEGQHILEFSVATGGGKLLYNLYIE